MCDPVTIGLAVLSSAMQLNTTRKNAKQAKKDIRVEQDLKNKQINAKNSTEAQHKMNEARAARARMAAQAAETGVAGLSIGELLTNVDFQSGTDVATIQNNNRNEIDGVTAQSQSSLNQIAQPDYLGTALQTGASLYGGATTEQRTALKSKVGISG